MTSNHILKCLMEPDLGLRLGRDTTLGFAGAGPTFRDVEKCFLLVNDLFLPPGKPLEPLKKGV